MLEVYDRRGGNEQVKIVILEKVNYGHTLNKKSNCKILDKYV